MAIRPRLSVAVVGQPDIGMLLAARGHRVMYLSPAQLLAGTDLEAIDLFVVDLPEESISEVVAQLPAGEKQLLGIHSLNPAVISVAASYGGVGFVFALSGADQCVLTAGDELAGAVAELLFSEAAIAAERVSSTDYGRVVAYRLVPSVCALVAAKMTGNEADENYHRFVDLRAAALWLAPEDRDLFVSMVEYLAKD